MRPELIVFVGYQNMDHTGDQREKYSVCTGVRKISNDAGLKIRRGDRGLMRMYFNAGIPDYSDNPDLKRDEEKRKIKLWREALEDIDYHEKEIEKHRKAIERFKKSLSVIDPVNQIQA